MTTPKVAPSMVTLRREVWQRGGMPEAVSPTETHWGSKKKGRHYEARSNARNSMVAVWESTFLGWMSPEEAGELG